MSDWTVWICSEEPGKCCPDEGCPESLGCARKRGWKDGYATPAAYQGFTKSPAPTIDHAALEAAARLHKQADQGVYWPADIAIALLEERKRLVADLQRATDVGMVFANSKAEAEARATAAEAGQDRMKAALESANGLCRSAHEIAKRKGAETNWPAFTDRMMEELSRQHAILWPDVWQTMESAPRNGSTLLLRTSLRPQGFAASWRGGFINAEGGNCGCWVAEKSDDAPPCWTDGACWELNEDEDPSDPPTHWKSIRAARQTPTVMSP